MKQKILSAISVLAATALVQGQDQVIPIKIAVLQPFGRPDDSWNWSYAAGLQMIQLAFEDAKTILPMADFQAIPYDSYSGLEDETTDAATSVFRVLDAIKDGVVAVIGDSTSDASMQSSLLTGNFKIPQCSFSSGSPYLSKKATYPYFFRSISSSAWDASKAMKFIKDQDWSQIAIIFTDNAIGRGAIEQANIDAKELGITVKSIFSMPFGITINDTSFDRAFDIFKQNDIRIFLMLGTGQELANFYITARLRGLFHGPDFVFVSTQSFYWDVEAFLLEAHGESLQHEMVTDWMYNVIEVYSSDGGSDAPWYNTYHEKWKNSNLTKYPLVDPDFATWNREGAYTCAWMIVHGFKSLVDELGGNETEILQKIVDRKMGEYLRPPRFSTGVMSPLGPMNLTDSGDFEGITEVWSNATWLKSGLYFANGSYSALHDIIYYGGSTVAPRDRPPKPPSFPVYVTNKDTSFIILAIVSAIGIALATIMLGLTFRYRNISIVKNSSPISNMLVLVGVIIAYASVYVGIGKPSNSDCMASMYMITVGFAIVFSNLLGKTYRLARVFNNQLIRVQGISNKHLLAWSAIMVLFDLIILIAWTVMNPLVSTRVEISPVKHTFLCMQKVDSDTNTMIFPGILFVFNGSLIVLGTYLSYQTRNVNRNFSDRYISLAIYNIALLSLITIPLLYIPEIYQSYQYLLKQMMVLLATTGTFLSLFIPIGSRMIPVISGKKSENEAAKSTNSIIPNTSMNFFGVGMLSGNFSAPDLANPSNSNYSVDYHTRKVVHESLKPSYRFQLPVLIKNRASMFNRITSAWTKHQVVIQKGIVNGVSCITLFPIQGPKNNPVIVFQATRVVDTSGSILKLMADELKETGKSVEMAQKYQIILLKDTLEIIFQTKDEIEFNVVREILSDSINNTNNIGSMVEDKRKITTLNSPVV